LAHRSLVICQSTIERKKLKEVTDSVSYRGPKGLEDSLHIFDQPRNTIILLNISCFKLSHFKKHWHCCLIALLLLYFILRHLAQAGTIWQILHSQLTMNHGVIYQRELGGSTHPFVLFDPALEHYE